ncbi:MAG: hypothetical protein ACRDYZ_00830 [Acidimicrobiales bacterium]
MTETAPLDDYLQLSSYRRCAVRIADRWPAFAARRAERLRQGLFGRPVEKVAENILEDLFTQVLDWDLADVNLQIGRADVVLSHLGYKRLVLEVKRPGLLHWHRAGVHDALAQAIDYATRQKVGAVAVSDGGMLYAADVVPGGLRDRCCIALDTSTPPADLWWMSVHGIYRPCPPSLVSLPDGPVATAPGMTEGAAEGVAVLHPKYALPSRCFAFVGSPDQPSTWKLPYLRADGTADAKRLPKALQSILSNFRGVNVNIPRDAVPDVLVRLGRAASGIGKMPCQPGSTAAAYTDAHAALDQLARLADVGCCAPG